MHTAVIIGTGNVATHLFEVFKTNSFLKTIQVVGRTAKGLAPFKNQVTVATDFKTITEADIYFIAVTDKAIAPVSNYLGDRNGIVVHTSGAVSMGVLSASSKGVFYLLQSFSKDQKVVYNRVPICIEASSVSGLDFLKKLGNSISETVYELSSEQRKKLHLAAVFANNFSNHMYAVAAQLCEKNAIPFELLHPLIQETAQKITKLSPKEAQTGPAKRNDILVLQEHLEVLDDKTQQRLYKTISEAIIEFHEEKL